VGQNSNAEVDNKHFQRGRTFEKFGTTITNWSYMQEEIKSSLKSRNACYHSVLNL
jgi:hypothetical protein